MTLSGVGAVPGEPGDVASDCSERGSVDLPARLELRNGRMLAGYSPGRPALKTGSVKWKELPRLGWLSTQIRPP